MAQAPVSTAPRDASVQKALSPRDRAELERVYAADGYVILRNVVERGRLTSLCQGIIDGFHHAQRSGGLFDGGGLISGHLNCFPGEGSRFVHDALRDYGVIDLVKAITPRLFTSHSIRCNVNLPKSTPQNYHIDGTFADRFTIVNVAAMDTDPVNGALELIPKTHEKSRKYWRFVVERRSRFAKQIPMSCGDILVRSSSLWPRGMPNRSSRPRPMLALTFGDKSEPELPDPFRQNEGRIAFYENRFRPTRLGRFRERTFVMAPMAHASIRFVLSLFRDDGGY